MALSILLCHFSCPALCQFVPYRGGNSSKSASILSRIFCQLLSLTIDSSKRSVLGFAFLSHALTELTVEYATCSVDVISTGRLPRKRSTAIVKRLASMTSSVSVNKSEKNDDTVPASCNRDNDIQNWRNISSSRDLSNKYFDTCGIGVLQMNRFMCSKSRLGHSVKLTCALPGNLAAKCKGNITNSKVHTLLQ